MIRVYSYPKCSTCRNALRWLDERGIAHEVVSIVDSPPNDVDLAAMLTAKNDQMRKLFNTSGMEYRAQGLKDKLPTMDRDEAFALLQSNGMLVKRPFLIGDGQALLGFREGEWDEAFR
jgi:arsenate reductase